MAQATLTITLDDSSTPAHPLTVVRDKLCIKWNYSGADTNPAKLDFIELKLAEYLKQQYKEQLQMEAAALNEAVVIVVG